MNVSRAERSIRSDEPAGTVHQPIMTSTANVSQVNRPGSAGEFIA